MTIQQVSNNYSTIIQQQKIIFWFDFTQKHSTKWQGCAGLGRVAVAQRREAVLDGMIIVGNYHQSGYSGDAIPMFIYI